uniref:rRNA N-glycosylase n=1 Tax=Bougainvillea spectabilis TaxID=146096 RepID=Q09EH2_9CARY|nr:ribosome inactivating protein [Bougainvillea spectabilis]
MGWWAIIVEIVLAKPSIITTKETASLGYKTVSFNLGEAEEYSTVIQELRNALANGAPVCNFPVTAKTIANDKRFVLVDLTTTSMKTITLAIDVTDVYVVGYRDLYNNKDRAVFLAEVPSVAIHDLFPGVTNREMLTFSGHYQKLQEAAKVNRENLELGVNKLGFAIESIYGKALNGKDIARFFLIAIQMMSEAARFKYIENEVSNGLYGSFTPNPKVLNLENNWGDISDAIHKSSPKCTTINPALQSKTPSNDPWVVHEVSEIRPDLGILKFKSSKLTQFITIIRSIVVEELDGGELQILEPNIA